MVALLDKTFTQLADLPGANRVHLAASVENHKISTFSALPEGQEETGEGDIQTDK
jgi:hypothetical protein